MFIREGFTVGREVWVGNLPLVDKDTRVRMNFNNPMESKKAQEKSGVFFENKDMDTLAAKFMNMQR